MNPLLLGFLSVVFSIRDSSSGFISIPGIQRRRQYDRCTFQWATTGPVTNVKVYNQTLGTATNLSKTASYTFDNRTGVISLAITKVRFWDTGNYSASVTTGSTIETNSGALLYVCGYTQSFINQTAGPDPPAEGDAVELSCSARSSSLPEQYRRSLYYFWYVGGFGVLQNISNGPALLLNGDVVTGHSISNNGRTLAIASARYQNNREFFCYGKEEGCSDTSSYIWFYLPLRYRPHITSRNPVSGKCNPDLYQDVSISFTIQANPSITSMTNWSFVSADGRSLDLPSNAESSPFSSNVYLRFNLTSVSYYGNYSRTATNSIGSTTETFQVLPEGPPDQPLSFTVLYASQAEIGLQYSCGWDNSRLQTIFIQLYNIGNDTALSTLNATVDLNTYEYINSITFRDNIEPDKEYEARAWASNALGNSNVVKLTLRTAKKLKFNVSPKTIRINGSQAIINFTTSDGNVSSLYITCCVEYTRICANYYFSTYNTNGVETTQVICDNIPTGNDYLFDFLVYVGNPYRYSFVGAIVKGMIISRTGNIQPNDSCSNYTGLLTEQCCKKCNSYGGEYAADKNNPLYVPVIVLGVLFGVAALALIGCLIVYLVLKCGLQRQSINIQQLSSMESIPATMESQMDVNPDENNEQIQAEERD